MRELKVIIISALIGAVTGGGIVLTYDPIKKPGRKELINDFYDVKTR